MKRFIFILSLVVGAWVLSPTLEGEALSWSTSTAQAKNDKVKKPKVKKPKSGGVSTPELDPGAAGGAMILLLGGVAYIASRRREEDLA